MSDVTKELASRGVPAAGAHAIAAGHVRREALLWLASRASAVVLAVCVVAHLATMIVAVRGGLTAAEILARTRGNFVWGAFYAVFVVAVAIHAPLGLRNVIAEMRGRGGRSIDVLMWALALLLLALGMRAVVAVTWT